MMKQRMVSGHEMASGACEYSIGFTRPRSLKTTTSQNRTNLIDAFKPQKNALKQGEHPEAREKTSGYASTEQLEFGKEEITVSAFDCIDQRLNNLRNSFFKTNSKSENGKGDGAIRAEPYKGEFHGLPRR